jgi:hypothetical protein
MSHACPVVGTTPPLAVAVAVAEGGSNTDVDVDVAPAVLPLPLPLAPAAVVVAAVVACEVGSAVGLHVPSACATTSCPSMRNACRGCCEAPPPPAPPAPAAPALGEEGRSNTVGSKHNPCSTHGLLYSHPLHELSPGGPPPPGGGPIVLVFLLFARHLGVVRYASAARGGGGDLVFKKLSSEDRKDVSLRPLRHPMKKKRVVRSVLNVRW